MRMLNAPSGSDIQSEKDEVLMSRYKYEKREEDFREIERRYRPEVTRYLTRYTGCAEVAEDVFQNTMLQIHVKSEAYEDSHLFRPWLYSIATHQAVDLLRKLGRHPMLSLDVRTEVNDSDSEPSALVDLLIGKDREGSAIMKINERRQKVRDEVDRLPVLLKETLRLAYFQDLKYKEIADIQKIPIGTVKSRLSAALAILRGSSSLLLELEESA
ncbi:MAG: sigW 2 [Candidatus Peribacteria bacterium]|nr:sigW 2 [Candidatus Peribacteria bacterium]